MSFDVNKLKARIKDYQESNQKGGGGDWAKTAFLPEGKHKGRFIIDPLGEAFESYYAYGYFNKGIRDPRDLSDDQLPPNFNDELRYVANELADRGKWKFRSKEVFLVWFYLVSTDSKEADRWEPDNLYCLIGNKKFSQAYTQFLESMATDSPEAIQEMLDPNCGTSPLIDIQVVSGAQGGVNISVGYPIKNAPVINLAEHVYCSLSDAYIKDGFDQDKYYALLKQAEEELEKTPKKEESDGEKTEDEIPDQGSSKEEPQEQKEVEEKKEEQPAQQSSTASKWEKWKR